MATQKSGGSGSHERRASESTPVTGGGEFSQSESGSEGRTSKTMGNQGSERSEGWKGSQKSDESGFETSRQTRTSSGNEGLSGAPSSSSGSGGRSEGSSSSSSKSEGHSGRYLLDCGEAGEGCSLKVSGTYDEVLSAGVEHGRSAHGMKGSDEQIRDDIKGYIKEEPVSSGMPGTYQGRGASQSGRSPGLPS